MLDLFASVDLEHQITSLGSRTVLIAAVALTVLVVISSFVKNKKQHQKFKKPLFISIVIVLVASTLILFSSTIYLNSVSDSGGPVHWHTDMEVWACGNELAFANPTTKWSNKIGTATLHEHNDKRIHLEGVVVNKEYDASLEKFVTVIGGKVDTNTLMLPLAEEVFETTLTDGDGPADPNPGAVAQYIGAYQAEDATKAAKPYPRSFDSRRGDQTCGGQPAYVQAFLYRYDTKTNTYSQSKLNDPSRYILRDEGSVPPGDCLILEYDVMKTRTDKLCKQYGVKDRNHCVRFGVPAEKIAKVCKIYETTAGGTL
jgi:hypothetical protein